MGEDSVGHVLGVVSGSFSETATLTSAQLKQSGVSVRHLADFPEQVQ